MRQKDLRIGVIGLSMGIAHIKGLSICRGGMLAAVCDIREDAIKHAREITGLSKEDCYLDYRELLRREDIDIVVIATPDQLHCEQTIAAMEEGKHVLCEKPMALSLKDCSDMIAASSRTKKKLMIGQIGRYTPGFIETKRLIDAGEIGELFFVESEYAHDYSKIPGIGNWRIDPVMLRHPVLGGGCHAVDLLRWIAGDPYEVSAFSNRKVLNEWPVDDCTIGIMKFPNNVIGKVMVSVGCKRDYTMRSVFYGNRGTIIADNTSNFITVYKENIMGSNILFNNMSSHVIGMKYPVDINNHNTAGEIAEFIDIVSNDKPVNTDGYQGASTVAVCLALVESSKDGIKVKVSYDF